MASVIFFPLFLAAERLSGDVEGAPLVASLLTLCAAWIVAYRCGTLHALGVWIVVLLASVLVGLATDTPMEVVVPIVTIGVIVGYLTVLSRGFWLASIALVAYAVVQGALVLGATAISVGLGVFSARAVAYSARILTRPLYDISATDAVALIMFVLSFVGLGLYFGIVYHIVTIQLGDLAFDGLEAPSLGLFLYESMGVLTSGDFPTLRPNHWLTQSLHATHAVLGVLWIAGYLGMLFIRISRQTMRIH